MRCFWTETFRLQAGVAHAWIMSSLRSGLILITQQCLGSFRTNFGMKYSVRMDTPPDIMMLWVVFAGIQTALRGGTIQMPCFVRTVITPLDAKTS